MSDCGCPADGVMAEPMLAMVAMLAKSGAPGLRDVVDTVSIEFLDVGLPPPARHALAGVGSLSGDNQDGCRIASSRNAPERVEHCLTRMLPAPRPLVNRLRGLRRLSRRDPNRLSCSIGEPAFPSRPGAAPSHGAQRRGLGGAEPPGATRNALFRASMARMASTGPSPK